MMALLSSESYGTLRQRRHLEIDAEEDDLSGVTAITGDNNNDDANTTTTSISNNPGEEEESPLATEAPSALQEGVVASLSPSSSMPTAAPSPVEPSTKINSNTTSSNSNKNNEGKKPFDHSFEDYCSKVNDIKANRQIPPLNQITSSIDEDTAQVRDDDTLDEVYYATHPVQTQLLHASVIFRHGSRAPWAALQCWNGYDVVNNPQDQWNCPNGVSNYMTTSPKGSTLAKVQQQEQEEETVTTSEGAGGVGATLSSWHHTITSWFHGGKDGVETVVDTSVPAQQFDNTESSTFYSASYGRPRTTIPYFLFDKQYDGLTPPEHNYLGGTCVEGQLLREGYDQHYENGQILRNAYFHNVQNQTNMNLFTWWDGPVPESSSSPDTSKHSIYLRSDDEQRTLTSLQILFQSFLTEEERPGDDSAVPSSIVNKLPTVIPLHTADLSLDVLDDNFQICPMLDVIRYQASQSDDYRQRSKEAWKRGGIVQRLQSTLGTPTKTMFDGNFIDCLMTQFCTEGRDVPEFLKQYNYEIFQEAYDYFSWEYFYSFRYNNGKFSKLAMGPLWEEILDPIQKTIDTNVTTLEQMMELDIPRLGLYSGHDETLAALLISLGPNVWNTDEPWIPYASMMILEYHVLLNQETHYDLFPSGRAFRLLYNGKVLTNRIRNCPSESDLCDFDVLMDTLSEFIGFDQEGCKVPPEQQFMVDALQSTGTAATTFHVAPPGQVSMFTVLSLCFVSILLSSVITTFWISRHYRKKELRRNLQEQQVELSLQGDYADDHGDGVVGESRGDPSHFTIDDEEDDHDHHHGLATKEENRII